MQLDLAGGKVDSSSVCDGEFSLVFFLGIIRIFICSILFWIFIFFHEFFDSFLEFELVPPPRNLIIFPTHCISSDVSTTSQQSTTVVCLW